jgi:hypothetical protein
MDSFLGGYTDQFYFETYIKMGNNHFIQMLTKSASLFFDRKKLIIIGFMMSRKGIKQKETAFK